MKVNQSKQWLTENNSTVRRFWAELFCVFVSFFSFIFSFLFFFLFLQFPFMLFGYIFFLPNWKSHWPLTNAAISDSTSRWWLVWKKRHPSSYSAWHARKSLPHLTTTGKSSPWPLQKVHPMARSTFLCVHTCRQGPHPPPPRTFRGVQDLLPTIQV